MPPADLFGVSGDNLDPAYVALRSPPNAYVEAARCYVDALWRQYEPYSEPDFVGEFAKQTAQRYWEMYLACALLDMGFALEKNAGTEPRPDIKATKNGQFIWVEAIARGPGGGADAVPPLPNNDAQLVPEEQMVMRYADAVSIKKQKRDDYINKGVVAATDVFLIAVSGGAVFAPFRDGEPPYILRAVFGIGSISFGIAQDDPNDVKVGFLYRPRILDTFGNERPTDLFFQDEYRGISGVVFCPSSIGIGPSKLGSDLIVIHNPRAARPFERGLIDRGAEYCACLEKFDHEKPTLT